MDTKSDKLVGRDEWNTDQSSIFILYNQEEGEKEERCVRERKRVIPSQSLVEDKYN